MKNLLYAVAVALLFFAIWVLSGYRFEHHAKKRIENQYAQKFEYKESEVNRLKRELDDQRLKSLRLQAALDSCKYNITAVSEVTTPKVTYKPKKKSKALEDCTNELVTVKAQLGECIGVKAQMEVEKDLKINKLKRQLDTCGYFVQEMDKALLKMSNDVTKLTNEKDSLINVLQTPIAINKDFPCLKAKKGISVVASVIPNTGKQDFIVNAFTLEKKVYKASKKSCKQTTR